MRTSLALALLVALVGCGGGQGAGSGAVPEAGGLTGLYDGGEGPRRNQLCLIEREGGTSFGFITWGSGDRNCSASGRMRREGDRLRLLPDGEESCALDARLDGERITLASDLPVECARYYCGDGARMAGAGFERIAGGEADAMRAVDLVGEPLCG